MSGENSLKRFGKEGSPLRVGGGGGDSSRKNGMIKEKTSEGKKGISSHKESTLSPKRPEGIADRAGTGCALKREFSKKKGKVHKAVKWEATSEGLF